MSSQTTIKTFNGFAGAGGNRQQWENVNVTAVEINPAIAAAYQDLFPEDTVIVGDAHKYLLEHYKEFDFIWLSPPCQSHSDIRFNMAVRHMGSKPKYPDMRLYQEILFLKHHAKCKWVVENVIPYYRPLIPAQQLQRHLFWANFPITTKTFPKDGIKDLTKISELEELHGIDLSKYELPNKRQVLRNCVSPAVGLHVFNCARLGEQQQLMECSL